MKKNYFFFLFLIFCTSLTFSQGYMLQEGFETTDTGKIPTGWSKFNMGNFIIGDTFATWRVRNAGDSLPGISNHLAVVHSGARSCSVTWWVGVDSNAVNHVADYWLVTKRIPHISIGDSLKFWATGGRLDLKDSMEVWLSFVDSLPSDFTVLLGSIHWNNDTGYGAFTQYNYNLSSYNGNIPEWIAFRYYCDVSIDGYCIQIDDVTIGNPIGIQKISSEIPKEFALKQNYPNPFNPSTTFQFDLPKNENVTIDIFNIMGQKIKTLVNEFKEAGSYKVDFDGSGIASGTYFYRITTPDFVKTNKMILIK